MGMTDEMFWRSTPAQFTLRVEAYKRHNRADAMYFRETFALLYNINRGEKAEVLEGKDILKLHGEKPPRKARREKSIMDDPDAMADLNRRINEMARREKKEADLFELDSFEYLKRRASGLITREMVEEAMRKKHFEENPDAATDSFVMPTIANPRMLGGDGISNPVISPAIPHPAASQPQIGATEVAPELETIVEDRSYVPPGLTGEPIPIQPSQWD